MGTIGYIRSTIRDTEQPIKDSIFVLLDCIEKLRPCGIMGEELESLASSVELLERVSESLEYKSKELSSFDSNQTSEDYLENPDND